MPGIHHDQKGFINSFGRSSCRYPAGYQAPAQYAGCHILDLVRKRIVSGQVFAKA
jgi:hypothetical protein